MSELKKCGICGAVSIRKDGHIFHKTDDCIRNLEARILELHSKIARLVEVGDKWEEICGHSLQCAINNLPVEPCDCGYEEQVTLWNKEAHE